MSRLSATVASALLERAYRAGVREIFANPGTTELPLHEALIDDGRFRYILGLHEVPVVAMADGFAQATRRPTLVNLHTACGLGNALGMIYNASCSETPLIITAGQQDRRLRGWSPVLSGDLVAMANGWLKWAYEPSTVSEALDAFDHAFAVAMTPPRGPVFLSLPMDLQLESIEGSPRLASVLAPPHAPPSTPPNSPAWDEVTCVMQKARHPLILAGSRMSEPARARALECLAERWGAPVRYESTANRGRLPLSPGAPLCVGPAPLWAADFAESVADHDVIFACCFDLVRWYLYESPCWPFAPDTRIIQVDDRLPVVGDSSSIFARLITEPELALGRLTDAVSDDSVAQHRRRWAVDFAQRTREAWRERAFSGNESANLNDRSLMSAIASTAPEDLVMIDEAATTTAHRLEALGLPRRHDGFFGHRGWALGWGIGCATGVQLAWPDRPVLAIVGDGAAAYGIQGLWTAARESANLAFIICHNRSYRILEQGGRRLGLEHSRAGHFLGTRLDSPVVDYVSLARGFGLRAARIESLSQLVEALEVHWTQRREPMLLEVSLD